MQMFFFSLESMGEVQIFFIIYVELSVGPLTFRATVWKVTWINNESRTQRSKKSVALWWNKKIEKKSVCGPRFLLMICRFILNLSYHALLNSIYSFLSRLETSLNMNSKTNKGKRNLRATMLFDSIQLLFHLKINVCFIR